MKRPSFQFYPADFRKDPALSTCSLAARGLWIDLMCIAHESEIYGVLSINGKPMTPQQIARSVGESVSAIIKLLDELEGSGVFSRNESGCIYSRRMVKDERLRNTRAEAGRLGGNPNLLKQKVKQKVNQSDNQILTPSSSSSSSLKHSEAIASGGKPPTMTADEIIFGYGVPLLTNAGIAEKQARSFLGGLRKEHGDGMVIDKLRDCMRAKPLQPLEWMAAALPPGGGRRAGKQAQVESRNAAVVADWRPPEMREAA